MLDEIVRVGLNEPEREPDRLQLSVVLPSCATGTRPVELPLSKPGEAVQLSLNPALQADDYRIIRQSLRIFQHYVRAITDKRLTLDLAFYEVSACVDVHFNASEFTGISDPEQAIAQLPTEVHDATDFWWVIYPSNVPEGPPFEKQHFFTGGMGLRGLSPLFIIDDLWLVRHPAHMGKGLMYDVERRAYLPQWLMHEFFHHLFRTWPELGLEEESHQWFNYPAKWPADFEGEIEPDYFTEALKKRLRQATPPIHHQLRARPPSADFLKEIQASAFVGEYLHQPRGNDWHEVNVSQTVDGLLWTNAAGVSWPLKWENGRLETGPECPYGVLPVSPRFKRDAEGNYTQELIGLGFHGGEYQRQSSP